MAKKMLASEALMNGKEDLRKEFLGYASAGDIDCEVLNEELGIRVFESVHDPDERKELVYIKLHEKRPFSEALLLANKHTSPGVFQLFSNFKGATEPEGFKEMLGFLARARRGNDDTYVLNINAPPRRA